MFSFLKDIDIGFKIPLPDKTIKVAITGFSQSGKSVFITSLINQLLANDKLPYLNEKLGIDFVAKLLPPDANFSRFDYYSNLKEFQKDDPSWPKPTKRVSKTTLQLEFKSRYKFLENDIVNIELIDYPGEWLLDLSMLEFSFEEWSDYTLKLAKSEARSKYSQTFLSMIDSHENLYKKSKDLKYDEIVSDSYVEYLKLLYYSHFSFLQPGRFLEAGDLSGDPMLHFAPLPLPKNGVKIEDNSIYARFKRRYSEYIKEVVNKLYLEHFKEFDTQIVLVDLIKTLEYGKDSFDDMRLAFEHILKSFTYGNNSFLSSLFGLKIDHVIFAATKADFIPRSQHQAYINILDELIKGIRKKIVIRDTLSQSTIISAVKSTNYINVKEDGEILECIEGVVEGENESSIFYPGEIPYHYNSSQFWEKHKFKFPKFRPAKFPDSKYESVEHIRMDRLIYSLLKGRV